jgi:hypothetical protein
MQRVLTILVLLGLAACSPQKPMSSNPLVLTQDQIDGDNPSYAAWDVLFAGVEDMPRDEFTEYVRGLPQHWRAVYTTAYLQGQVENGGHHQFFWNSDGVLNQETLADLKLISAQPFVLLFDEALDVYAKHDYEGDKRDSGNTWEAFTEAYDEKRMDELDDAFYKVPKSVSDYMDDYIRTNRKKYMESAEPDTGGNR